MFTCIHTEPMGFTLLNELRTQHNTRHRKMEKHDDFKRERPHESTSLDAANQISKPINKPLVVMGTQTRFYSDVIIIYFITVALS